MSSALVEGNPNPQKVSYETVLRRRIRRSAPQRPHRPRRVRGALERAVLLDQRIVVELRDHHGIPTERELHACDPVLGIGQALLADEASWLKATTPITAHAQAGSGDLHREVATYCIEEPARKIGGVEVINACLRKSEVSSYERASPDRLFNRIDTSVSSADRLASLILNEGYEQMVSQIYRRLRGHNHVSSRYEGWED